MPSYELYLDRLRAKEVDKPYHLDKLRIVIGRDRNAVDVEEG